MGSTIDDVAARAGVSTATVSRALRGVGRVSERSRRKVLAAADELGYVISPTAQALATGRTMTVALVVPSFSEWFSAHVLDGVQRALQDAGYTTVVHSVENVRGMPHLDFDVDSLRRRTDGVIVIGMLLGEADTPKVEALGVPVVVVGNLHPHFTAVGLDDVEVGRIATDHLVSLGHRVIGHLSGSEQETTPLTPAGGRLVGWRCALEAAGLEHGDDLVSPAYFDVQGGADAMDALLDRRPDVTAVFAAADCIAAGAIRALSARGLRVPEDVSVIGVDGEDTLGLTGLTTVEQDPTEQGRISAEVLISLMERGGEESDRAVSGVLRPGVTTAPVLVAHA